MLIHKLLPRIFLLWSVLGLVIACNAPAGSSPPSPTAQISPLFTTTPTDPPPTVTATSTPMPPTSTPTELSPTATPTIEPTATSMPTPVLISAAQQLIGTWFGIKKDGMYQRFNADGTCQLAMKLKNLSTTPNVKCTYRFEDSHFFVTQIEVSGLPECLEPTGEYQVYLLANGNILFKLINDTCLERAVTTAQEHEPVP